MNLETILTLLQDRIVFHQYAIEKLHTNQEDIDISKGQIMECQYLMQVIFNELEEEIKDDRSN